MAEASNIKLIGGFEVDTKKLDFIGLGEESKALTLRTFFNPLCSAIVDSILDGALFINVLQTIWMPGSNWRQVYRRFRAGIDRGLEELKTASSEVASNGEGIKNGESFILEQGGLKVYANSEDASYVTDKIMQLREEASQGAAGLAR